MKKKIEYKFGQRLKDDSLLSYLFDDSSISKERKAFFLCECGNVKSCYVSLVKRGNTRSCGCLFLSSVKKHGNSQKRIYKIWKGILYRCDGRDTSNLKYYKDKGIDVCPEWSDEVTGFENFLRDMGEPERNQTIDRIDNSKGYFKENCRWADSSMQKFNRTLLPSNKSGKTGVAYSKTTGKWHAYIYKEKQYYDLGMHEDFIDAVNIRREYEVLLYGQHLPN